MQMFLLTTMHPIHALLRKPNQKVKIQEKENAMAKSIELQQAHENARKSGDDQLELYRSSLEAVNEKLVTAVNEIKKGNQEISRQQQEINALKDKIGTKSEVIRKQEALVSELQTKVNNAAKVNNSLDKSFNDEKSYSDSLRKELEKAKERLNDSANIISNNQEVITWLNREISRYQLTGGVGPLGAESYLYEGSPNTVMATESPLPTTGQYKNVTKLVTADSKILASYDYLKKTGSGLKGLEGILEEVGADSRLDVTGVDEGYYAGLFGSEGSTGLSGQKSVATAKMY